MRSFFTKQRLQLESLVSRPSTIVGSKISFGNPIKQRSIVVEDDKKTSLKGLLPVLSGLVLLKIATDDLKRSKCHAEQKRDEEKHINNFDTDLQNVCNHSQYPANFPIEDRFVYQRLGSGGAYLFGVFDGHGGWQFSHYAAKNLPDRLQKEFAKTYKSEDSKLSMRSVLTNTYATIEAELLEGALKTYQLGFGRGRRAGSCGLVAVVADGNLTIANIGDSQAVLCRAINDTRLEGVEVSKILNAMNPEEQHRLKREFPDEEDIFYCKRPDCCYVKRRLQPTRAFGDFDLKYKEFNNPEQLGSEYQVGRIIPNYSGGYINAVPDLTSIELSSEDRFLILATDGLWDELSPQEATDIVLASNGDTSAAAKTLRETALKVAAKNENLTLEELKEVRVDGKGERKRRRIHDDITVVVIDLQKASRK